MKKLLLSFVLGVGFGAIGFAAHQNENLVSLTSQKTQETKKQKTEKYDFSLFKFVTPSRTNENDSLNNKPVKKEEDNLIPKNRVSYIIPRDFFKFS